MIKPETAGIGKAIGFAVGTVGKGVELLGSALRLSGLHKATPGSRSVSPGAQPGIEHLPDVNEPPAPGSVTINCIDYSSDRIEIRQIEDLETFLGEARPDWVTVRWVNVVGLHPYVVNRFREHHDYHTLAAEDVLHVPQRPRVELFGNHAFVVVRMLQLVNEASVIREDEEMQTLDIEQVSMFLFKDTLLTFQQKNGDVWQPIRERLIAENTRFRKNSAGYLLYALLDAIVDHCFPVLEQYGNVLEELELVTLEHPTPAVLHRIHSVKRELALLRRIVWPTREVVDQLYREEEGHMGEATRPYLRDVYEHTIQVVEIIESYREMASGLTDLYMSAVSNRMNEVMKVLTIMASVFIPLTFLAGIYGMNFEYMPELSWPWAYPLIWLSFAVIGIGMVLFFRHKGWLGDR